MNRYYAKKTFKTNKITVKSLSEREYKGFIDKSSDLSFHFTGSRALLGMYERLQALNERKSRLSRVLKRTFGIPLELSLGRFSKRISFNLNNIISSYLLTKDVGV